MRVAFVTQWFPPERGSVIAESIAAGLARRGHEVDVLTAFPNYPTGRLYPGWRQRPYLREQHSPGVTVHRTPVYTSHDSNAVRRMANYLSHATSATVIGASRIPKPDVWLVYSSPATAALPAQLARPGTRAPVCLLIQDLWPDSVTGSGMVGGAAGRVIERSLGAYARFSYRQATTVGVISPGMAEVLVDRGVPRHKIAWTPNWIEDATSASPPAAAGSPHAHVRRRFLYAGNLGTMQALPELVDAFASVPEAELVLMGEGVEAAALRERARDIPNVHVAPPVPHSEVESHLRSADALVLSLQDTPLLRATMPSKMQAYLKAGRPILAHAAGDAAELVGRAGAGVACRPGDLPGTVEAIRTVVSAAASDLDEMGHAGANHYEANFSPEVAAERLEALLLKTVAAA